MRSAVQDILDGQIDLVLAGVCNLDSISECGQCPMCPTAATVYMPETIIHEHGGEVSLGTQVVHNSSPRHYVTHTVEYVDSRSGSNKSDH